MSKIICDICGTTYPETAEQCPICGCARDMSTESYTDDLIEDEVAETSSRRARGGRFSASNVRKRGRASRIEEPEEDEYDEDDDVYESNYDDDDDDDEEEHKSNAPLVVLLIVVIAALLTVTGYIFVKFFLPNILPEETTVPSTAVETTAAPEETTEPTIPCTDLAMTSGGNVELKQIGENWLINVMVMPEDTTDKLVYTSSDEAVVTVNEEGKLTAVGEGTATVTITCGEKSLECYVTCNFTPVETTAPVDETTAPEETTEPTEATEPLKDVTLKVLKWTDLTFNGPNQGFTFVLDGLRNDEVKWTSMDENVVTVDENGVVLSVGPGSTTIICEYGDQKVEIKIRCAW